MTDYEQSRDVFAPAEQLFDYLADVRNLPKYFPAVTSAEPADGDAVHVTAQENGNSHEATAWFRVNRAERHLDWGSEGPNDYHGRLDVTAREEDSRVTVSLHSNAGDDDRINGGLSDTLAQIARLVEPAASPDPSPNTGTNPDTTASEL